MRREGSSPVGGSGSQESAIVVRVVHDVPGLAKGLVEPDVGCGDATVVGDLAFLDVERAQEQLAGPVERTAAEREAMEVGVGPVESSLQHLMDDVERQVRAQVQPTPDRVAWA